MSSTYLLHAIQFSKQMFSKWHKDIVQCGSQRGTSLIVLSHCLIVFLLCQHFCIPNHFKIIRCTVKTLIATSTYFLLKYCITEKRKLEKFFWVLEFGCPNWYTGLPNALNMAVGYHPLHGFISSCRNILIVSFCGQTLTINGRRSTLRI